jgi:hypothetical protein
MALSGRTSSHLRVIDAPVEHASLSCPRLKVFPNCTPLFEIQSCWFVVGLGCLIRHCERSEATQGGLQPRLRRRPITSEAIGSAATHPSLRGALATKQSRGHNMRGASNPDGRTAAPGLLRFARNDVQRIGSLVSACRLSTLEELGESERRRVWGRTVRRRFGDSRPLWGGLESGDDSPIRRNPGHPKAILGYVVGSRRTRTATFRGG